MRFYTRAVTNQNWAGEIGEGQREEQKAQTDGQTDSHRVNRRGGAPSDRAQQPSGGLSALTTFDECGDYQSYDAESHHREAENQDLTIRSRLRHEIETAKHNGKRKKPLKVETGRLLIRLCVHFRKERDSED